MARECFFKQKKRYKRTDISYFAKSNQSALTAFLFTTVYLVILVSFLIIPYLFSILVFFFWFSWVLISEKDIFLLGLFSVIVTSWKTYVNHMKYFYIQSWKLCTTMRLIVFFFLVICYCFFWRMVICYCYLSSKCKLPFKKKSKCKLWNINFHGRNTCSFQVTSDYNLAFHTYYKTRPICLLEEVW